MGLQESLESRTTVGIPDGSGEATTDGVDRTDTGLEDWGLFCVRRFLRVGQSADGLPVFCNGCGDGDVKLLALAL